jgi:hypothetical protein
VVKPDDTAAVAIIADIVAELKKGGPLKNPLERAYPSTAPADYVQIEVQRSINRIPLRQEYKPSPNDPTASDYRKLGRLLRKVGLTAVAEQIGASDHVRQEPPPRANALKHFCADEAFFLMEGFSAKEPTFSTGGPYQIIAQNLYEAVTGKSDADLERACDWVLRQRRKVRQNHSSRDA